ncbi:MAG: hypothetical protein WC307_05350 [Candidatus Nanoarchaeia archaeon]|jgi:transcription initiation factor TFIIIB Brf1 subunit/transcription initiation factor TFIIB
MEELGVIALFGEFLPCPACGAKFNLEVKEGKTICTNCCMEVTNKVI